MTNGNVSNNGNVSMIGDGVALVHWDGEKLDHAMDGVDGDKLSHFLAFLGLMGAGYYVYFMNGNDTPLGPYCSEEQAKEVYEEYEEWDSPDAVRARMGGKFWVGDKVEFTDHLTGGWMCGWIRDVVVSECGRRVDGVTPTNLWYSVVLEDPSETVGKTLYDVDASTMVGERMEVTFPDQAEGKE